MNSRRWPRILQKRDRVAVVTPSGPSKSDDERGEGIELLRSWDLEPVDHSLAANGYRAGSDTARLDTLQQSFDDPDVAAVLCLRGGFGVDLIIDKLDVSAFVARAGVFVGYSDATTLHTVLNRKGLVTFYGPPIEWKPTNLAHVQDALHSALCTDDDVVVALDPNAYAASAPGVDRFAQEAPVLGGNVTVLASSCGTRTQLKAAGAILFLEEDYENSLNLDRRLTQLRRAGVFRGVAGIALGQFTEMIEEPGWPDYPSVLAERLGGLGVPICAGVPVGHGAEQMTLPLGAKAVINSEKLTMTFARP